MTEAIEALKALASGFATTFKHLFRKPITEEYPEYKRPLPARARARIILTRDPDGNERCVACYLCSGVCPVSCISMQVCHLVSYQFCTLYLLRPVRRSLSYLGYPVDAEF
jgi:formate hydrogenlyase subunit 6/NADH:ubiquinone oxidoreductase subunit I